MHEGGFRSLPVVEAGRLVGIITDRDVRLATNSPLVLQEKWYGDFMLESIKVKACMAADPITVTPITKLLDAVRLIRKHKFGGMPVVSEIDGSLVGMITTTDVLDHVIRTLEAAEASA